MVDLNTGLLREEPKPGAAGDSNELWRRILQPLLHQQAGCVPDTCLALLEHLKASSPEHSTPVPANAVRAMLIGVKQFFTTKNA